MKPELLARVVNAFLIVLAPAAFSQTLLTEAYLTSTGAGGYTVTNSLNLTLAIGSEVGRIGPVFLFEGLFVQTTDVGHTYTIGPGDDPHFAAFARYLTDGLISFLGDEATLGPAGWGEYGIPETRFFAGLPPGNNGIDLGGFKIDYFSLCFNTLAFTSPGRNLSGDGIWTDCDYEAVFSVYGQPIPEPTSLAIFSLGVATQLARVTGLKNRKAKSQAGKNVGANLWRRDR